MLKQIETSTQAQVTRESIKFEKDMGNGIVLATTVSADGNTETCEMNMSTFWQALLASPDFV